MKKNVLIIFAVLFLVFSNSCKREDLVQGGDFQSIMKLKSSGIPLYETESLANTYSGPAPTVAADAGDASADYFSNMACTGTGQYIKYTFNVPFSGTFTVRVMTNRTNNRGIVQPYLDDASFGSTINLYNVSTSYVYVTRDIGSATLTAGNHTLKFVVTGKDAASSSWKIAFDYIDLIPANAINVTSYGATGDDSTDDTADIQAAINACASGGTVYVPNGTFMVNAVTSLLLKSDMHLNLASGATIKAIANNSTSYNIIKILDKTNVSVYGGTIQGERAGHTGTAGQWGMGVGVKGSSNVTISNVIAKDCWGDGFYIGYGTSAGSSNVTLTNCTADNNRRNGMSVAAVATMMVSNSTFSNTNGQDPQVGIDIEPNTGNTINNVTILNCSIFGNTNSGMSINAIASPRNITNMFVTGCNIYDHNNGSIHIRFCDGTKIRDCTALTDNNYGVTLKSSSGDYSINNTITGNDFNTPIPIRDNNGNNTISGNSNYGVPF